MTPSRETQLVMLSIDVPVVQVTVDATTRYEVRPLTRVAACAFVKRTHRHLRPPVGDVIRVGLFVAGTDDLAGVAMAGRPVARMLDDGRTLEITRVAVGEGVRNGCSMLYGSLRRAGQALGWLRFVTYTLPEEGGASLRASGWREDGVTATGDKQWSVPSRPRAPAERPEPKTRWVYP